MAFSLSNHQSFRLEDLSSLYWVPGAVLGTGDSGELDSPCLLELKDTHTRAVAGPGWEKLMLLRQAPQHW